jgi:hypothetical protein
MNDSRLSNVAYFYFLYRSFVAGADNWTSVEIAFTMFELEVGYATLTIIDGVDSQSGVSDHSFLILCMLLLTPFIFFYTFFPLQIRSWEFSVAVDCRRQFSVVDRR